MPTVLDGRGTPGYEIYVESAGPTIPSVAVYSRCYLLITNTMGTQVTTPNTFYAVGSMDDFTNLFGTSTALILNSIAAYLANNNQGLYIARVTPYFVSTVTVTASAGVKTLTLAGTAVSVTPDASPALDELVPQFIAAINDNATLNPLFEAEPTLDSNGVPTYTAGTFRVRSKSNATFTIVGSTGVTASAVAQPGTMNYWDWVAALRAIADTSEDIPLGFLACPQAFYTLTNQFERTQVANTMESVARSLNWFAYLDPHVPSTINHPSLAKLEAANYNAVQGHAAYTYPYFVDTDSDHVAPSVVIPAVALRLYKARGIQEPPAGVRCLIDGLSGVQYTLNTAQKVDLAEAGVNINVYQTGYGAMPYDTWTRATNAAFQMINGRIILSSFARTLRDTLRSSNLLFQSVDGQGRFYSRLSLTVTGVCELFYRAGALYGDSPGNAYFVKCDAGLQDPVNLERGIIVFDVYIVPVPIARRIKGYVYRVAIDQIAQTVAIESL